MNRQSFVCIVVAGALIALGTALVLTRHQPPRDGRVHLVFEAGVGLDTARWMRDMAAAFNNHQDRIRINPRIGPPDRYNDKLLAEFATGAIGDIVELHVNVLPQNANAGVLLDLEPYLRLERFRGLRLDDLYETALYAASFQGRQLALPLTNSAMTLFYNKDLFDAAGVAYPEDDWDWDDWEAAWARLTRVGDRPARDGERPDVYGTFIVPDIAHVMPFIWSHGGQMLNDDYSACVLDSTAAIGAARFYLERMARYAPNPSESRELSHQQTAFMHQRSATILDGPWAVQVFQKAPFRWDAALLPRPPGKPSISRYTGLTVAVSSRCPHPEEALEFIQFLLSEEAQIELVRRRLDFSPRPSIGRMDVTLDPDTPWDEGVFVRAIENSRMFPKHADVGRIIFEGFTTLDGILVQRRDVGEAFRDLTVKSNAILAERVRRNALGDSHGVPVFAAAGVLFGAAAGLPLLLLLFGLLPSARLLRRDMRRSWRSYAFIAPNALGFLAFALLPILAGFLISLTEWNIIEPPRWIGLRNYAALFELDRPWEGLGAWWTAFSDTRSFGYSIYNTLFMMLAVPLTMAGSLLLAVLLNRSLRLHRFYRLAFFLPSVTVGVGIFFLWELLLQKEGLVNRAIDLTRIVPLVNALFGTRFELVNWFHGSTWTSKPAIMLVTFWGAVGGRNLILYLAGLAAILPHLYEAAEIDGAGWRQKLVHITIPMLAPTSFFIFVTNVISAVQGGVDIGLLITKGGPDRSTTGMGLDLYQHGWVFGEMGLAAAMGYVMFALILVMTLLAWRWGRSRGGAELV